MYFAGETQSCIAGDYFEIGITLITSAILFEVYLYFLATKSR
jgi:hypothetical protein